MTIHCCCCITGVDGEANKFRLREDFGMQSAKADRHLVSLVHCAVKYKHTDLSVLQSV